MYANNQIADAIRTALAVTDPVGLLAHGCPEDEYASEVNDLAERVIGGEELNTFMVMSVFWQWFGVVLKPRIASEVVLLVAELQ